MPKIQKNSINLIAGLDEVGLGALAGPLCIVVVAFPDGYKPIPGVKDSKQLSRKKREALAPVIVREASYIGVGWASAKSIDTIGVVASWQLAAHNALESAPDISHLFVDGRRKVERYRGAQSIHDKGESKYWQIAAASIVAKVLRDNEMGWLALHYPVFDCWAQNAGYGTEMHNNLILRYGPTPLHRRLYLRNLISPFVAIA